MVLILARHLAIILKMEDITTKEIIPTTCRRITDNSLRMIPTETNHASEALFEARSVALAEAIIAMRDRAMEGLLAILVLLLLVKDHRLMLLLDPRHDGNHPQTHIILVQRQGQTGHRILLRMKVLAETQLTIMNRR
jgi:hypothetical protein